LTLSNATNPNTAPLVILAYDAGDLEFLLTWARDGYLPTLDSILKRGCWGRTAGPEHVCEHGSWVTTFSGVSRREHGYYSYRQLRPGTYELTRFSPQNANAVPFWHYLRSIHNKVAVIDAPEVLPSSGLRGIQLSNWATHQPDVPALPPSAEPACLMTVARRVFGPSVNIREYNPQSSFAEDREIYQRLMERTRKRGELCRHLLAQDHYDLVVIGLHEGHKASHRFWEYRTAAQARGSTRSDPDLRDAIRNIYVSTDRELGLVLQQLPDDANVVLVSLYGMKDEYPTTGLMDSLLRQLGYQPPAEPSARSGPPSPLTLLRRAIPESVRATISQRLPTHIQERLLADRFRASTNWQETTAFAITALFTSFIRVNLRGREPKGIVAAGAEYTAVLNRLEADLMQLVDPITGGHAVHRVARSVDCFGGGPPELLPDLFVEWTPTTHLRRKLIHPCAEITQDTPGYLRGNEHTHYGLFAAAGPAIKARGELGDISILDLAPTFLTLLGQNVPPTLRGRVLPEVLHDSLLKG
jgi:predicted AlkP superfamily phosphohydrolase/phosphomutase